MLRLDGFPSTEVDKVSSRHENLFQMWLYMYCEWRGPTNSHGKPACPLKSPKYPTYTWNETCGYNITHIKSTLFKEKYELLLCVMFKRIYYFLRKQWYKYNGGFRIKIDCKNFHHCKWRKLNSRNRSQKKLLKHNKTHTLTYCQEAQSVNPISTKQIYKEIHPTIFFTCIGVKSTQSPSFWKRHLLTL